MNTAVSEEQEIIQQVATGTVHPAAETETEKYVREHFPDIDPGMRPTGARVLVQLRKTPKATAGGIVLVHQSTEFNDEHGVVARVVALGQLAFRNRETQELWPEGVWCQVGDIIVIPRMSGIRFRRPVPGSGKYRADGSVISDTEEKVIFCFFDDHQIQGVAKSGFTDLDQIL